ncbi:MAG: hypothetical protein IT214_06760 [Chitinophagaceae bacterium]|nr:hypothetical protein [Chitinophagaceae bacterium]
MIPKPILSVLSLFLLVPASISWAQTITTQKGLSTIQFLASSGVIKVYLPDDISPGDIISGTIGVEPSGKTAKQLGKNFAELKKYIVSIENQSFTIGDYKQNVQFSCRENSGKTGWEIIFRDGSGNDIGRLITPFKKGYKAGECNIPDHILTGSPVTVPGPFDGNASNTISVLDEKPVSILAESPRQCILSYPAAPDAGGIHTLTMQENSRILCSQKVSGVEMNVAAGKLKLMKGEQTFIEVTITGLMNLQNTAVLTLNNITSAIVTMLPANKVVIPLPPDSVGSGTFIYRSDIQSLKSGSFIIAVDLDLPDALYEIKKLDKPRRLEDKALHTGLSEAIKKLEADAGGAQGKEYSNMCESCQKCIRAMAGTWAEDLVEKLGEDLIKESVGKAIGMFTESKELLKKLKEMVDKANEAGDKAEKLAEELEKKIREKELQLLVFKDKLCDSNKDCVVSAMIFYDPSTGCVTAFVKCNGRAGVCCPKSFNTAKITYCTDEHGMPKDLPQVEVISE